MDPPNSPDHSDEIKKALFAGNKIEAIKLYRGQFKVGLAEAKAAVEAMEGRIRGAPATGTPDSPDHTEAIREALFAGRKIMAIKLYREQCKGKVGLAEAKTAVEAMEDQLRRSSPGQFSQVQSKGCFSVFVVLVLLGFALWKALN